MIQLYDTLSGEKKELPEQKKIRLFVCGPTVYDYAHIGHARTYIFFDFFAKFLRRQGYEVTYLQNITDIDDKIIQRAVEQSKKPEEVAEFFTKSYIEDMQSLGIEMTTDENEAKKTGKILYAPATKFISQIAAQVEQLIDKGFAYKIDGDGWYFDISKDEDYGKLSRRTSAQAEDATSRIDEAVNKRNKGDFCLWKFSKSGEPSWTTSLGAGRPGWHIEDTAISEFYFGPQYEIHGGGVDLKFPHHEAEIAQQESASGLKPFVQFWMHTGALLVDGKKMSKSSGNFITIRDFLKKYSADALHLITLNHDYRSPVDFSEKLAGQSEKTIDNVRRFLSKLEILSQDAESESQHSERKLAYEAEEILQQKLRIGMENDLNSAMAIAELFQQISNAQIGLWDIPSKDALTRLNYFKNAFQSLGFSLEIPQIPQKIRSLAKEQELSRSSKQFEQSDRLRKEINDLGYDIEDTPKGPFLWPRQSKRK